MPVRVGSFGYGDRMPAILRRRLVGLVLLLAPTREIVRIGERQVGCSGDFGKPPDFRFLFESEDQSRTRESDCDGLSL